MRSEFRTRPIPKLIEDYGIDLTDIIDKARKTYSE
jgi:hypothetical protein